MPEILACDISAVPFFEACWPDFKGWWHLYPNIRRSTPIRGWGPPEKTSWFSFYIWQCGNIVSAQHMLAGGRPELAVLRISHISWDAVSPSSPPLGSLSWLHLHLEMMSSNLKISWSLLPLKRVSHFAFVTNKPWFPGRTANVFKLGPIWPHLYYLYGTHPAGPIPLISIRASTCTFWGNKIQSITDP